MTENSASPSAADPAPAPRPKRRTAKGRTREVYFEALAEGWTHERIAELHGVSVATVRREAGRAIAARQIQSPDCHVRLQIARVMKALALLDARVSKGDMAAVGPFLKAVAALDRYHGIAASVAPAAPVREAAPRLTAPPLALTHAAPPFETSAAPAVPATLEAGEGMAAVFSDA
jgi:hypothetical protein